jgi:hypothetical protein
MNNEYARIEYTSTRDESGYPRHTFKFIGDGEYVLVSFEFEKLAPDVLKRLGLERVSGDDIRRVSIYRRTDCCFHGSP